MLSCPGYLKWWKRKGAAEATGLGKTSNIVRPFCSERDHFALNLAWISGPFSLIGQFSGGKAGIVM